MIRTVGPLRVVSKPSIADHGRYTTSGRLPRPVRTHTPLWSAASCGPARPWYSRTIGTVSPSCSTNTGAIMNSRGFPVRTANSTPAAAAATWIVTATSRNAYSTVVPRLLRTTSWALPGTSAANLVTRL
jgi:hypothetical protein